MGQNETNRHFELRNLDHDMRKAAEDIRPISVKEAKRLKMDTIWTLAALAAVLLTLAFALELI